MNTRYNRRERRTAECRREKFNNSLNLQLINIDSPFRLEFIYSTFLVIVNYHKLYPFTCKLGACGTLLRKVIFFGIVVRHQK